MATGVEFGHIDRDWLFDCLRVGSIIIDEDVPEESSHYTEAQCLYLGPKGIQVSEEYLEERFRLYNMVYMHKTTRSAEKMLESLLKNVSQNYQTYCKSIKKTSLLEYFADDTPSLYSYLSLDDTSIWSALSLLSEVSDREVSDLAIRIRDRKLYKCIDIAGLDREDENLFRRFRHRVSEASLEWSEQLLYDDSSVTAYKWYDFDSASALKKVLVKPTSSDREPRDIATISQIVEGLRRVERIQRVYAPSEEQTQKLESIATASLRNSRNT